MRIVWGPGTVFNATNFENYVNELVTSTKPKRRPLVTTVLDFNSGDA
ncbi:hypothetical protein [Sporosarcina sp. P34]|nr:hypothetical protein [Sporosarcina sp. P34]